MFRLKMLFGYLALAVFAGISVLAALFAIHANFTPVSLAISDPSSSVMRFRWSLS